MNEKRPRLIEKISRNRLLPEELERKRQATPAVVLEVEGYPDGFFPKQSTEDGENPIFSKEDYPVEECIGVVDSSNKLALYRKAFPHGLYGTMLIDTETNGEVAFHDYPKQKRLAFLNNAFLFAQHSEENAMHPTISWTHDPETNDRKSGQSKSWFHMHLNAQSEDVREYIQSERQPLNELENIPSMRSVVDEYSILFSLLMKDYFSYTQTISYDQINGPFEIENLPNLSISLGFDWESIDVEELDNELIKIHNAQEEIYEQLLGLLFVGKNGKWERPRLQNEFIEKLDNISWISSDTKDVLIHFLSALRPELLDKMKDYFCENPKSNTTSFLYPLAGCAYGISIFKAENGEILLSVRPQLFSDSGTAGLFHMFGTAIKVTRGSGEYTDAQLTEKMNYEESLLSRLQRD